MLRRAIERWSRDRVVRRRLPPEFGSHALFVSPDASLRLWRRDLRRADPLLLGLAAELVRPGDRVWDVGANVGLFAFAAAFLAGPSGAVLAVEADGWLAGLLRRSAESAGPAYAPVEVLAAAVAESPGVAELHIAARGRAGSHLGDVAGSTQAGGVREVRQVAAVTLDGLLATSPPPRLVKIDVEGAEARCLRGAGRLLAEVRPVLLCEVSEPSAREVGERLLGLGYTLYDAEVPPGRRRPLATPAWNTLAVTGTP